MKQEAAASAAARAAADALVSERDHPRGVQAGAALTLFAMAAWRHAPSLADPHARASLAAALKDRLTARELASAASHLRWLVCVLSGPAAQPASMTGEPAADCVRLFAHLARAFCPDAGRSEERGAWAVLRFLAHAQDQRATIAAIAGAHRVSDETVLAVVAALVAAGHARLETPASGDHAAARLTPDGADLARADPLLGFARQARDAFDAEALSLLIHLGAAFLRAETASHG